MRLVIYTCHKHGALVTGGMAAKVLPTGKENATNDRVNDIINQVYIAKKAEIEMGVDGKERCTQLFIILISKFIIVIIH